MCGISGIVSLQPISDDQLYDRQIQVKKMVTALNHRGPDANNVMTLGSATFGHNRLSIIDLETGDQPMRTPDGRFMITFNGEIYNYKELRNGLEQKGMRFITTSDTEVLLQLLVTEGVSCLSRLNGMFAFVFWDSLTQKMLLVRDRFGKKPLYYSLHDGELIFASEIKSLFAAGEKGVVNPEVLAFFCKYLYVPPHKTIFSNIFTLRPGHYLEWDPRGIKTNRYWKPKFGPKLKMDFREAKEELFRLVKQAVRQRMLASDVPVGAFLSGGFDSGTVVALMAEISGTPVKTFSVGFGKLIDELPAARQVAQRYGTEHHEIQIDYNIADMIENMATVYDEPFADPSHIPQYIISKFASESVKVVLSGDGGDELFGGYDWWYYPLYFANHPELRNPKWFRNIFYRLNRRGKWFFPGWLQVKMDFYKQIYRWQDKGENFEVVKESDWARHKDQGIFIPDGFNDLVKMNSFSIDSLDTEAEWMDEFFDPLDGAFARDIEYYLPGDILTKVDRATMANGLEARSPLLDVEVAEFALRMPLEWKIKGGKSKVIFKETFQHLLPPGHAKLPKQGFAGPFSNWIKDVAGINLIRELISNINNPITEFVDLKKAQNIFETFLQGDQNPGLVNSLWVLTSILAWGETWGNQIRLEPVADSKLTQKDSII